MSHKKIIDLAGGRRHLPYHPPFLIQTDRKNMHIRVEILFEKKKGAGVPCKKIVNLDCFKEEIKNISYDNYIRRIRIINHEVLRTCLFDMDDKSIISTKVDEMITKCKKDGAEYKWAEEIIDRLHKIQTIDEIEETYV
jgi:hypothetical protein